MKRVLIALFVLAVSYQAGTAQVRIGFKGGLNLSEVRTDDKEENKEIGIRPAFHVGVITDISLSSSLSLQPQLYYSGRGAKADHGDHKDIFTFHSIELPVNLLYKSACKSGTFFIGGGPSLGVNLSGKLEASDDPSENFEFEFGSKAGQIKRADVGFNVLAGYELKNGLLISANYTRGITNWTNTASQWRNNTLGISVGYFLGKAKKK